MPVSGHVTIEKTGKSLKMQQLLSLGLILLGFTIMAAAFTGREPGSTEVSTTASVGSAMFVCGLFWRVLTRMRIWWHHG